MKKILIIEKRKKAKEQRAKGSSIKKAVVPMQVAISMKKPTFGRQIKENDVLYVDINEEEMKEMKTSMGKRLLSADEEEILEELERIKGKIPKSER